MKMLSATSVAALALGLTLSGSAVYAADYPGQGNQDATTQQQNDNDKNDKDNKNNRHGKPAKDVVAPVAPVATDTQQNDNKRNVKLRRGTIDPANDRLRPVNDDKRDNWNDNRRNNRNWNDNRRTNRNWNDRRTNIDMTRWHRNFDAPRRFRIGTYNAPRGYSYRRYSYGQRLPRDYYVRNFWLMDFVMFGLYSPPDGYVWVRYGPDALLIDEETGEIIQVQYNVFYS